LCIDRPPHRNRARFGGSRNGLATIAALKTMTFLLADILFLARAIVLQLSFILRASRAMWS
jgi:hypothetical protein